jgi:hypothetical protein
LVSSSGQLAASQYGTKIDTDVGHIEVSDEIHYVSCSRRLVKLKIFVANNISGANTVTKTDGGTDSENTFSKP